MAVFYRTLREFPDYKFGDDGTVWSKRKGDDWVRIGNKSNRGRIHLSLYDRKGGIATRQLHTLILTLFKGPPREGEGTSVRFKDGNRNNCRVSNMHWGRKPGPGLRGEAHGRSRLTEKEVRAIKQDLEENKPVMRIARERGCSDKTVRDIRDGVSWGWLS